MEISRGFAQWGIVLILAGSAAGLPQGWTAVDIGGPKAAGRAFEAGGLWTVFGDGRDIWGTADCFYYVYKEVSGDCTITAKVLSIQEVDGWALAGLMVREDTQPGSKYAMVCITASNGCRFYVREAAKGNCRYDSLGSPVRDMRAPLWIRLVRAGNELRAYYSEDGLSWLAHPWGVQTIPMAASVCIGMAVTSKRDGYVTMAEYEHVEVLNCAARPDLQIATEENWEPVGGHIFGDAALQTATQVLGTGMTAVYEVKLTADYLTPDSFTLYGSPGDGRWTVRYSLLPRGEDITAQITDAAQGWPTSAMDPGRSLELRLEVTAGAGLVHGESLNVDIQATSTRNNQVTDLVRAATSFDANLPVPPYTVVYTTNEDFDRGTLVGAEHDSVPDQLQLEAKPVMAPFLWVPNSNEGTVSKIDARTGRELARYRTCPASKYGNPSRTTVDQTGSCWLGNRRTGTVVKIGLFENDQYVDRNHNGMADTSRDLNGDGLINGEELLAWGDDECVICEAVLIPGQEGTYTPGAFTGTYANSDDTPGPRGIAVDKDGNLWVGCYGTKIYYYIDGLTGEILRQVDVSSANHKPYGAIIDGDGIVWSSGQDGKQVLWLDPADSSFGVINLNHYAYGIGIDVSGHKRLFVSGWSERKLSCVDTATRTVLWTKTGGDSSRGVVCAENGDVWVADSAGTASHYTNDGDMIQRIQVGHTPTGVAIDADGKVWVVCLDDGYLIRIDPATNLIDLTTRLPGTQHYGYSDMTGFVSRASAACIGTWTVVHHTHQFDSELAWIDWAATVPRGTSLSVAARSSNNRRNWSTWEHICRGTAPTRIPGGRYYEIQATLQSDVPGLSPVLYDLTVTGAP